MPTRRLSLSGSKRLAALHDVSVHGRQPGKNDFWNDAAFSELASAFDSPLQGPDGTDVPEQVRAVERIMSRLGLTEDALLRPYFELERAASVPPDSSSSRNRPGSVSAVPVALTNAVSMVGSFNASILDPTATFRAAAAHGSAVESPSAPVLSSSPSRAPSASPSPRPDGGAIPKIQVQMSSPAFDPTSLLPGPAVLPPVVEPLQPATPPRTPVSLSAGMAPVTPTSLGPLRVSKSLEVTATARLQQAVPKSQSWDFRLSDETSMSAALHQRNVPWTDAVHGRLAAASPGVSRSASPGVSPRLQPPPRGLEPIHPNSRSVS